MTTSTLSILLLMTDETINARIIPIIIAGNSEISVLRLLLFLANAALFLAFPVPVDLVPLDPVPADLVPLGPVPAVLVRACSESEYLTLVGLVAADLVPADLVPVGPVAADLVAPGLVPAGRLATVA